MDSGKTVLVLGGGVGGVVAARRLRRHLPTSHRVVLVERAGRHVFAPSLLWLAVGRRSPGAIQRPLPRLLPRGVELVEGTLSRLDVAERTIEVEGRTLRGDAVVIALGADLAPEAVPGLRDGGFDLCTLDGATGIRDALAAFRGGRIVILTAAPAYKCPGAPYELAMLIADELRRRGLRGRAQIDIYAAESGPMPVTGPVMSLAVRQMVEAEGIGYYPEHQVTSVDAAAHRLTFAGGAAATYDLLAYVPPHRAPAAVREAGLTGPAGWIPVDRGTLETSQPGVYAVGDVTTIPLAIGRPLPKAGVFAHRQAEVVAANIARAWTGRGRPARFDGHGECFLETGGGRAGFGSGDFFAEPAPRVTLRGPAWWWHAGKVLLERRWLSGWI